MNPDVLTPVDMPTPDAPGQTPEWPTYAEAVAILSRMVSTIGEALDMAARPGLPAKQRNQAIQTATLEFLAYSTAVTRVLVEDAAQRQAAGGDHG